jgi:DNA-binding protein YbaB
MADFSEGLERFQRDVEAQMGDFGKMRESIREAVGRGEAADGQVVAEYTVEGGVSRLDLDPRAMRMGSQELAQEIRTAVNAAAADFQAKVREASVAMFNATDAQKAIDPSAALASLDKMSNGFAGQMKELARELGLQQQRAKEAMDNYRGPGHPGDIP